MSYFAGFWIGAESVNSLRGGLASRDGSSQSLKIGIISVDLIFKASPRTLELPPTSKEPAKTFSLGFSWK